MSKIDVMSSSDSDDSPPNTSGPEVVSHRGKMLEPLVDNEEPEVQPDQKLDDRPKESQIETPLDIETVGSEPAQNGVDLSEANQAEPKDQIQPEVVDPNQYRLPIKTSRAHGGSSAATTVALLILLVLVVLMAYVAADMDMYDPGFDLPFEVL
jgi:hypothetical protein